MRNRLPARVVAHRRPSWSPLALRGLPPLPLIWQPIKGAELEGDSSYGHMGNSFGDGSGKHQDEIQTATATWSVVRMSGGHPRSTVRGRVLGWFPTVPRAELSALVWHLRSATCPATYIGDCAGVIRGVQDGVPEALTSSKSLHADLWQRVAHLLKDHGPGLLFIKTKAHRSRAEAERSVDDPLMHWLGNQAADEHAKELCRDLARNDARLQAAAVRGSTLPFLKHIGIAAAWCFKHWPSRKRQKKRRGERTAPAAVTRLRRQATVASRTHPSHCVMETRGLFWCCRCGAHARRVPRSLRRPCVGAPRSVAYRQLLKRLRKGLLPGGVQSSRVDIAPQKPARVQVQGTTSVVAAPIKPQESRPQSEADDAMAKHFVTEKQPRSCGRKTVTDGNRDGHSAALVSGTDMDEAQALQDLLDMGLPIPRPSICSTSRALEAVPVAMRVAGNSSSVRSSSRSCSCLGPAWEGDLEQAQVVQDLIALQQSGIRVVWPAGAR